ncbi:COP9 signalosome complex subunit 3 isoform X2 [Beta vulgaris subsp. vulgaris]|uniref:COP9 signalosome complex subunit 3 isoform X2 n=1 Tax=Beta vulgaris subsp. vulgaris TaxID=3555 RepID=UPI002546EC2D|nr:COP9 signalosome complex subunit 3 isoform X2 [Beta vulgaris subsp. vulgaris]
MDAVERVVAQIQGLSGSAADLNNLHVLLKQSEDSLRANFSRLPSFLLQLDTSAHSLGYLYFLDAYTASVSRDQTNEAVLLVARFISSCLAEQIRLAHHKFICVCKRFKDQLIVLSAPMRGVAPMLTAIHKIRPSSEHLTTLHPDFLSLCVLAKCYKTGLSVLEDDVFEVDQPKDLFLYCYYGALIYIGLKKFEKALELLHNTYLELANCYSNGKIVELETFLQVNKDKFEVDNNLGLVKQVVSSIYKRNIQRLTQTYLTLSLQDIATTVQLNSPKEAEMYVLQMIQDGHIYATINQKDGMVRFLEDPEQYKTCEMIEHIDCSIQRIMSLSKKLASVDELISCDPLYLTKVGKERQRFDFDDYDSSVPQKFTI